jgi:hypothetical protein
MFRLLPVKHRKIPRKLNHHGMIAAARWNCRQLNRSACMIWLRWNVHWQSSGSRHNGFCFSDDCGMERMAWSGCALGFQHLIFVRFSGWRSNPVFGSSLQCRVETRDVTASGSVGYLLAAARVRLRHTQKKQEMIAYPLLSAVFMYSSLHVCTILWLHGIVFGFWVIFFT